MNQVSFELTTTELKFLFLFFLISLSYVEMNFRNICDKQKFDGRWRMTNIWLTNHKLRSSKI